MLNCNGHSLKNTNNSSITMSQLTILIITIASGFREGGLSWEKSNKPDEATLILHKELSLKLLYLFRHVTEYTLNLLTL